MYIKRGNVRIKRIILDLRDVIAETCFVNLRVLPFSLKF